MIKKICIFCLTLIAPLLRMRDAWGDTINYCADSRCDTSLYCYYASANRVCEYGRTIQLDNCGSAGKFDGARCISSETFSNVEFGYGNGTYCESCNQSSTTPTGGDTSSSEGSDDSVDCGDAVLMNQNCSTYDPRYISTRSFQDCTPECLTNDGHLHCVGDDNNTYVKLSSTCRKGCTHIDNFWYACPDSSTPGGNGGGGGGGGGDTHGYNCDDHHTSPWEGNSHPFGYDFSTIDPSFCSVFWIRNTNMDQITSCSLMSGICAEDCVFTWQKESETRTAHLYKNPDGQCDGGTLTVNGVTYCGRMSTASYLPDWCPTLKAAIKKTIPDTTQTTGDARIICAEHDVGTSQSGCMLGTVRLECKDAAYNDYALWHAGSFFPGSIFVTPSKTPTQYKDNGIDEISNSKIVLGDLTCMRQPNCRGETYPIGTEPNKVTIPATFSVSGISSAAGCTAPNGTNFQTVAGWAQFKWPSDDNPGPILTSGKK